MRQSRDTFSIFFNIKIYCVFSLESPHQGDSNEYTKSTIFNIKMKITLNYPTSAAMGFFSKELKNEFKTAVVNETSVFEPLKVYCIKQFKDLIANSVDSDEVTRYDHGCII